MASPKNKEPRIKDTVATRTAVDAARKEAEMAEKKMTQVKALEIAAEFMADAGDEYAEVVEVIEGMVAKRRAPRKPRENKAAIAFAEEVYKFLAGAEGELTNGEIAAGMSNGAAKDEEGDVSFQKVAAAIRRLEAEDRVVRIKGEKAKDKDTFMVA
jgi:hypothetical protein